MRATQLVADWAPRPGHTPTPTEEATHLAGMACTSWRNPRLEVVEVPSPDPAPGQAVVRVAACGVCGSDTHCVETDDEGYVIFSGPARFPCVLGHECAGQVVAVGDGVVGLAVGDWVTAESVLYCGVCEACRGGRPNQCIRVQLVGFGVQGAFTDAIALDAKALWPIDAVAERTGDVQLACELAALVEPVACSYNGMFVAAGGMMPGAHVAVFGCGPIGLGAVALARAAGAATVTAFDVVPERREVARSLGADQALDPTRAPPGEVLRQQSRGWGADMLVEAAGAALHTMPEIERALAPGAKVVYLGRTGLRAPVLLDSLVSAAASIVGARGHAGGGCYPHILRLMAHGRLDLSPMISARLPMEQAVQALERSKLRTDAKLMLVN